MPLLPVTAADFYAERDDRTSRCIATAQYQLTRCGIAIDLETASTFEGQVMALTATNLLSRWCRYIELEIPPVALDTRLSYRHCSTLRERLSAEMAGADPFGKHIFSGISDSALVLGIGRYRGNVSIDASGWFAVVGASQGGIGRVLWKGSGNPVGAGIAACLGMARLFGLACGARIGSDSVYDAFSLRFVDLEFANRSHHPECVAIDAGRVLQVGVGAVGSSLLYFLTMLPIRGRWILVDHDDVRVPNLNRSLTFGVESLGGNKATLGADVLAQANIECAGYATDFDKFLKLLPRTPNCWDIVLPLANEFGVRWRIQNQVPPLMIYGTTTTDWGVNFGRHIPTTEQCLVCRYPNDSWQPQYECGGGEIPSNTSEDRVDAALPFASPLASLLILGELLKLSLVGYPFNHNFVYLDLKSDPFFGTHYSLPFGASCICQSQLRAFEAYNAGSKCYWATRSQREQQNRTR